MPFAVALGIELDAAAAGEVRGHLAWSPERCTAGGIVVQTDLTDNDGRLAAQVTQTQAVQAEASG